jgi:hypothetical protein
MMIIVLGFKRTWASLMNLNARLAGNICPFVDRVQIETTKRQKQKTLKRPGLVSWSFAINATRSRAEAATMPRACPVESHAQWLRESRTDAATMPRLVPWSLTLNGYKKAEQKLPRCHGLAPWSFTLAATKSSTLPIFDVFTDLGTR